MYYHLHTSALAQLVRTKRAGRGLRETAQEIGAVSAATLSRVENGKAPDLLVFLQLCHWLALPPGRFFVDQQAGGRFATTPEPLSTITYLLRSDPRLDPTTANMLATMVEATYQALRPCKI